MKTKGIRQAENESPYTVKTTGATWWKEEALSRFQQLGQDQQISENLSCFFQLSLFSPGCLLASSEQNPPPSIQPKSA